MSWDLQTFHLGLLLTFESLFSAGEATLCTSVAKWGIVFQYIVAY